MANPPAARSIQTYRLTQQLNGTPRFLGTIVLSTTAASNASGTSKDPNGVVGGFNASGDGLQGKMLLLQPDAACFFLPDPTSTPSATTSNGVKLAVDERVIVSMTEWNGGFKNLSGVVSSGAGNLRVWELV